MVLARLLSEEGERGKRMAESSYRAVGRVGTVESVDAEPRRPFAVDAEGQRDSKAWSEEEWVDKRSCVKG
jgi:hypothetical protein